MRDVTEEFPTHRPMFLGVLIVIILVGGFGGGASIAEVAGAIMVRGQIEVDQNRSLR